MPPFTHEYVAVQCTLSLLWNDGNENWSMPPLHPLALLDTAKNRKKTSTHPVHSHAALTIAHVFRNPRRLARSSPARITSATIRAMNGMKSVSSAATIVISPPNGRSSAACACAAGWGAGSPPKCAPQPPQNRASGCLSAPQFVQNVTHLAYPFAAAYDDSVAQSSLPLTTAPRTITVRVRTLVILALIAAVAGAVWWALSWASGMRPLAVGAASTAPLGLTAIANTENTYDSGPAVYRWRAGGRYVVVLYLHNSSSVPVTITGADHPGSYWVGWFTGPYIGRPGAHDDAVVRPFRPVQIPADGMRGVSFVFRANPKACGNNGRGSELEQDVVDVHFETLGIFHDTQTVPLGIGVMAMTGPAGGC